MTEDELLSNVIEAARLLGWDHIYHVRNSKAGIVQGDPGFPDLVLLREATHDLMFVELKTGVGQVSDAQIGWLDALREAAIYDGDRMWQTYIWRPADWRDGTIERTLR